MKLSLLVLFFILATISAYELKAAWYGGDIIYNFSYFTGADPTHGTLYNNCKFVIIIHL